MFVKQILATHYIRIVSAVKKKEKKKKFYIFKVLYLNFKGVIKKRKIGKGESCPSDFLAVILTVYFVFAARILFT